MHRLSHSFFLTSMCIYISLFPSLLSYPILDRWAQSSRLSKREHYSQHFLTCASSRTQNSKTVFSHHVYIEVHINSRQRIPTAAHRQLCKSSLKILSGVHSTIMGHFINMFANSGFQYLYPQLMRDASSERHDRHETSQIYSKHDRDMWMRYCKFIAQYSGK